MTDREKAAFDEAWAIIEGYGGVQTWFYKDLMAVQGFTDKEASHALMSLMDSYYGSKVRWTTDHWFVPAEEYPEDGYYKRKDNGTDS